jgi:alanyl-tRNA synthetase
LPAEVVDEEDAAVGLDVHGELVGEVAKVVGGKGGGPPTGIAQAGGKDASKLGEALQLAKKLASEKLTG